MSNTTDCAKKVELADKYGFAQGFAQGLAYAVAQLIRYGNSGLAKYIVDESGLKLKDFKAAHVDDYDLNPIKQMLAEQ